jgi:hypothetical protein
MVVDVWSKNVLRMSVIMKRELNLIERLRNVRLVFKITLNSVKLSMTNHVLEEIKEG